MDANQHVNNVKYIGWLLEVIKLGSLFPDNILLRPNKNVVVRI